MTKTKHLFIFDFDGVVCDSTDECMVTSWNAWQKWSGKESFRNNINEFSEEEQNDFRPYRYYVKGAGDYYVLRRLISEMRVNSIKNCHDFDNYKIKWNEQVKAFKEFIFESRAELRNHSISEWIGLHQVYDEIIDFIRQFSASQSIFIATLKDLDSVKLILSQHEIFLPEEKIFHQGIIKNKLEALDIIRKNENIDSSNMYLFDDNISHLLKPFNHGYRSFQTTWGNVPPDYISEAKKNNVPLIDFKGLKELTNIIN